jgi:coenzyme Q-binding protein COQ10
MADIHIIKHFHHRWDDLFELVLDIGRYPAFVPHCTEVEVLSHHEDDLARTTILSRMTVGLSVLRVSYMNRTVADLERRRIDVESIDGPLRYLRVVWKFDAEGDEDTEIHFSADYEFSNPLLAVVAPPAFDHMFGEIVNAFERRADELFGRAGDRA